MLGIGHFARHGRVSVRMLRHYDAIGLLRPAHVDRVSGYRYYDAEQLSRLNRIVALKGLGFTLQQVQAILDDRVSGDGVLVHATVQVNADRGGDRDLWVTELQEPVVTG